MVLSVGRSGNWDFDHQSAGRRASGSVGSGVSWFGIIWLLVMPSKALVMLLMLIGSTVGGFVPTLFGADIFSFWPLITSAIGGIFGIWLAFKISA